MSQRSSVMRWLDWQLPISRKDPEVEPTKPSKPGFEGFDGSIPGDSEKMRPAGATMQPAEKPLHPGPELGSVGFDGPHQRQFPKIAGSKVSKLPDVTPFQKSFFDELAQIPAETLPELHEKARGKPRECIEAYWRWKLATQSDAPGE